MGHVQYLPRVAETLEPAISVEAASVAAISVHAIRKSSSSTMACGGGRALVLVHAEGAVGRVDVAGGALAHVRPHSVPAAAAPQADPRVLQALVHVEARQAGGAVRSEPGQAHAAEGAVVAPDAVAVGAAAGHVAVVSVQA